MDLNTTLKMMHSKLSSGAVITVCSHTFIILWLRGELHDCWNVFVKFPRALFYAFHLDTSLLLLRVSLFYFYLWNKVCLHVWIFRMLLKYQRVRGLLDHNWIFYFDPKGFFYWESHVPEGSRSVFPL